MDRFWPADYKYVGGTHLRVLIWSTNCRHPSAPPCISRHLRNVNSLRKLRKRYGPGSSCNTRQTLRRDYYSYYSKYLLLYTADQRLRRSGSHYKSECRKSSSYHAMLNKLEQKQFLTSCLSFNLFSHWLKLRKAIIFLSERNEIYRVNEVFQCRNYVEDI